MRFGAWILVISAAATAAPAATTAAATASAGAAPAAAAPVEVAESGGRVVLRNAWTEVEVRPRCGMYVTYARDRATGKEILSDLKLNFPFYEHGIREDQPAGWRVVRGKDGSATVAMNMRFGHHKGPKELQRYGRFGERILSELVTLRPGSAALEFRGRADNPTPLRRSVRLWDRAFLPTPGQFLMPASHGIEHNALWIKPWPAWEYEGKMTDFSQAANWGKGRPTQYFALYQAHPFSGGWYPAEGVNRLRIHDPAADPGVKVYYAGGGRFELWGGTTVVFESPGRLVDGYTPVEYTKYFYLTRGIGRADWADRHLAVHAETGLRPTVQVTGPMPLGDVTVSICDGRQAVAAARGSIGPGEVLTVQAGRPMAKFRVTVAQHMDRPLEVEDGRGVSVAAPALLLEKTFPLEIPDHGHLYEKARAECNHGGVRPDFIEVDEHPHHHTSPGALAATRAAKDLLQAGGPRDRARATSLACACYRIGDFASAAALAALALELDAACEDAHHVLGLIACEQGRPAEAESRLKQAGVQALYLRALMAHAEGQDRVAAALLEELLRARPRVYRPRMLAAVLTATSANRPDAALAMAKALVDEDPASPEACETLHRAAKLAGDDALAKEAAAARDALVANNPDAARQLGLFRNELDHGRWVYPARYQFDLPQP